MKLFKTKITANALQFSMLISVIVLLLISGALLIFQNQKTNYTRIALYHEQTRSLNHFLLKTFSLKDLQEPHIFDNNELETSDFWGAYRLLKAKNSSDHFSLRKFGLFGGLLEEEKNMALYLENNRMPLVVAGDAYIQGQASVPSGYIKKGSVNGQYFQNELEVYPLNNSGLLPALDNDWVAYIESVKENELWSSPLEQSKDSSFQSFKNPGPYINSFEEFTTRSFRSLGGYQILFDPESITIDSTMKLKTVMVVSPSVHISDRFKGSIQIISNDIVIGKHVELLFPSSLVSYNSAFSNSPNKGIYIGENTEVQGNIIYMDESEHLKVDSNIFISSGSKIQGNIYCQGYLNLQGEVSGTVISKYLLTENKGGKYLNHLFNGRIESSKSKENNVGLPLVDTKYTLASWVY